MNRILAARGVSAKDLARRGTGLGGRARNSMKILVPTRGVGPRTY